MESRCGPVVHPRYALCRIEQDWVRLVSGIQTFEVGLRSVRRLA